MKTRLCEITLRLLAAAWLTTLLGCAGTAPAPNLDPLTSSQIVVYPLQEGRTDKKTKVSCTPVRPVSSKYLSGLTHSIVHFAFDEGLRANFTEEDLLNANRQVLKAIPHKGESYALILVLSEWGYTAFSFKYDLTAYLVRIADGEVIWNNKARGSLFKGLLTGPLEKLTSFGNEPYDFHYGNALMIALKGIPKNLPK